MPDKNAVAGSRKRDVGPYRAFLDQVTDLARSVDPKLAILLGDNGPILSVRPWTGDRRRGLELCLSMLRYAHAEAEKDSDIARIEGAMAHVMDVLGDIEREQPLAAKPSLWELLMSAPIDGTEFPRDNRPMRKIEF